MPSTQFEFGNCQLTAELAAGIGLSAARDLRRRLCCRHPNRDRRTHLVLLRPLPEGSRRHRQSGPAEPAGLAADL
jgi:hypothetical protein